MTFSFYRNEYDKKKPYLYYSKYYFINLALQNSIFHWKCSNTKSHFFLLEKL